MGLRPASWPPAAAASRRRFASAEAAVPEAGADERPKQRWDITEKRWVDIKFEQEDFDRFPLERAAFRADPRLRPDSLPELQGPEQMDWIPALWAMVSVTRLGDFVAQPFTDLCLERVTEGASLMERFDIPVVEDKGIAQPLHSKAVPTEGAYIKLRMQAYWLALHVWLLHSKQYLLQEHEGLFGSMLCALLTRRVFEWQWDRLRMWLYAADVPVMSITGELQDLQEFIFGLCAALDEAFREEAAPGGGGTAAAIALEDSQLPPDGFGLAPRVKYALWANVYSGAIPHDSPCLHELTVYILRQRMAVEALARGSFFMCQFEWADHPLPPSGGS